LDLLADVAFQSYNDPRDAENNMQSTDEQTNSVQISPALREALVYPKAPESLKPVRKTLLNSLPDNLSSLESIRAMSLKQIQTVVKFAEKEHKAKLAYMKKKE
jgi:hypothetical protein